MKTLIPTETPKNARPADTMAEFHGWVEFQTKDGKRVSSDDEFKKIYAKIAIGRWFVQERLPLHLLKLDQKKQSDYLDAVNKRLMSKLCLALSRRGVEIRGLHSQKPQAATTGQVEAIDKKGKDLPSFDFEEA